MIDVELKDLIRKAYKAGRRNALKLDELNFNDFINKHESKLKLFSMHFVSNNEVAVCKHCGLIDEQHSKTTKLCPNIFNHFEQTDC